MLENDVLVECHGFCGHVLSFLILTNAVVPICLGLLAGYQIKIIIKS
jgi:hypothetical protein